MRGLKHIILTLAITFIGIFIIISFSNANNQTPKNWTGTLGDGTKIMHKELYEILLEHRKWLKTIGKNGERANLSGANLSGANLSEIDLSHAILLNINLKDADLFEAKLVKAELNIANLENACLQKADLSYADLTGANLTRADLTDAKLTESYFENAEVRDAIFEIQPKSLPNIKAISIKVDIELLRWVYNPNALAELRKKFKDAGLRRKERQVTYAINRSYRLNLLEYAKDMFYKKKIFECGYNLFEGIFYYIAFEITCKYGLSPKRSIFILISLILIFSIPYTISIKMQKKDKKDGIWIVWSSERMRKDIGNDTPSLLSINNFRQALKWGLFFSILSAFHIGWRDLNVGSWINHMQYREYTLSSTGWVRFLSGFQSLLSVYLLALWVLTYFGRPFE